MEERDDGGGKISRLRGAIYSRSISPRLTEAPRHTLKDDAPPVPEDWHRQDDGPSVASSFVAPRTIMMIRMVLRAVAVLAVLFLLGAVGFFAYYFLAGGGSTSASASNIEIFVSGPTRIPGGESTKLQIIVTNHNPIPLELTELVISYPPGTRSPTDYATDLSVQRIPLGTIGPGEKRQGTVSAVFAGAVDDLTDVKADLEYRLHGSSAIFVAHSSYSSMISASPLSIAVQGKDQTVSGQPMEFTVTVSSNTSVAVKDVLLSFEAPFGFVFSRGTPAPAMPGLWELGDLSPGETRSIVIRGTLTGGSGDERVFRFNAGTRTKPEDKSLSVQLASNSFKTLISEPFLDLAVFINESNEKNITLAPGDPVKVSIRWANNLSTAVTDAVIVARLSGIRIDGATSSVSTSDGFFRSTDWTVLWDKTTTKGALASLQPGQKGTVSFGFTMPSGEQLGTLRDPRLTISVNAGGSRMSESNVPQNLQSTVTRTASIASDLQIRSQAYYYNNPFGVIGPMPPKAGTETGYGIVFALTNTTNKIRNGKVVAHLPPYVRWMGIYGPKGESVSFDQASGNIIWNVGDIEPGVGMNGTQSRQLGIAIGFTPSTSQIGQEPNLIEDITFTGTDDATGKTVSRQVEKDLTTNIVGDEGFVSTDATVVR